MMGRVNMQEGDYFPSGWVVWGEITPFSKSAPVGFYFILRLPFYTHNCQPDICNDSWVTRWMQKAIIYRRWMHKGREGAAGKWRLVELPTEDAPTSVQTWMEHHDQRPS